MRRDEDAAEAFDPELLDEAHAAHIGGEIIDFDSALDNALAVFPMT
jgi:hypothetical protein